MPLTDKVDKIYDTVTEIRIEQARQQEQMKSLHNKLDDHIENCKPKDTGKAKANKEKWYIKNIDAARDKNRNWKENHPDRAKEINRKKERKRRAMKENVQENYTAEDEKYTMDLFNHQCFNCGDTKNLEIDHIYPLSKGNPLTRKNACILCNHCNSLKSAKNPEDFYEHDKLLILLYWVGFINI